MKVIVLTLLLLCCIGPLAVLLLPQKWLRPILLLWSIAVAGGALWAYDWANKLFR